MLQGLKAATEEVLEELAAQDELSGRVWASFNAFQKRVRPWTEIGHRSILNNR